jgi:hypothetical protein
MLCNKFDTKNELRMDNKEELYSQNTDATSTQTERNEESLKIVVNSKFEMMHARCDWACLCMVLESAILFYLKYWNQP